MNEQTLIDELRSRAAEDARNFAEKFPGDAPSERWMENSFTAALPLAKDRAQFHPDAGTEPRLFEIYKSEIARLVGGGRESNEATRGAGAELTQQPTRGEG